MLASHALVMLGLPMDQVQARIDEVRQTRYRMLQAFYHGAQTSPVDSEGQPKAMMHAVNLGAEAYACGRPLTELDLEQLGVEVQAVQRNGEELAVDADTCLHAGDAVLLSGPLPALTACEARLVAGR
jgi:CPA2 family monovalent cation:H+ antiporter-2